MPNVDFFNFFRYLLGTIVTIYATIVTIQSLWSWYIWLAGSDKYVSLVRRYVIVHGLRLRFTSFWGDVIISILLTIVFCMLWHAHTILRDLRATMDQVQIDQRQFDMRQKRLHGGLSMMPLIPSLPHAPQQPV